MTSPRPTLPCIAGKGRSALIAAVLAVSLILAAANAHASPLRRIATNIGPFASDGARYVAWEAFMAGSLAGGQIEVLDTRTARKHTVSTRCGLEGGAPAAAGLFLVSCGHEEQGLLNVRTGVVRSLPPPPPHLYGEYGPVWTGVGRRYLVGKGGLHARCHRPSRHERCTALYDIATAAVREVPESTVPDPDRPGAPPLCGALRRKIFLRSELEALEGLGPLAPLGSGFSYRDGVVAHPEEIGEDPVRHMRVERCNRSSVSLPAHQERGRGEAFPWNVELGGGLLTWDTGHTTGSWQDELVEGRQAGLRDGTLDTYRLAANQLHAWRLPPLRLRVLGRARDEWPIGVFGYSAHTANTVFWIAAEDLNCEGEKGICGETERSDIYRAQL
jgi:hypothetical protein